MSHTLTFHTRDGGNNRMAPTYYIEADCIPIAVRIHAENAPVSDAKIDIFDDDVSIFENRTLAQYHKTTGADITGDAVTEAVLGTEHNSTDFAGNLKEETIEEGSWVHCNLVDGGSGKNFTVHLEVERLHSEGEPL